MRRLWLRHPRPAVRPGTCYGRLDVAEGPTAAAEIAAALRLAPPVAAVWASPSRRCRQLARRLAARDGVALHLDTRLLELDFGRWEGMAWDEISRAESDPWAADPWALAPPGGERFADLHARIAAVLETAPDEVALVCHAGPIRAGRMQLGGESFETAFAHPVPYAFPLDLTREPV
ncbi:MAG: histidine phosphatase family protein [Pseudomonadota bacterium]